MSCALDGVGITIGRLCTLSAGPVESFEEFICLVMELKKKKLRYKVPHGSQDLLRANCPADLRADGDVHRVTTKALAGCPRSLRFGSEHQPAGRGEQVVEPALPDRC